jgi:hypothetical protein
VWTRAHWVGGAECALKNREEGRARCCAVGACAHWVGGVECALGNRKEERARCCGCARAPGVGGAECALKNREEERARCCAVGARARTGVPEGRGYLKGVRLFLFAQTARKTRPRRRARTHMSERAQPDRRFPSTPPSRAHAPRRRPAMSKKAQEDEGMEVMPISDRVEVRFVRRTGWISKFEWSTSTYYESEFIDIVPSRSRPLDFAPPTLFSDKEVVLAAVGPGNVYGDVYEGEWMELPRCKRIALLQQQLFGNAGLANGAGVRFGGKWRRARFRETKARTFSLDARSLGAQTPARGQWGWR